MNEATFFGWLFIAVGAVLLVGVAALLAFARTSTGWLSAPGRVVASGRAASQGIVSHDTDRRLSLLYEYEVGGRKLQGTRIRFGDAIWAATARSTVRRLLLQYPPGREVTVFYDPLHPERCTLDRKLDDLPFYPTMAVAAILLLGGLSVLLGWVKVQ
jgi:hypothetical protein